MVIRTSGVIALGFLVIAVMWGPGCWAGPRAGDGQQKGGGACETCGKTVREQVADHPTVCQYCGDAVGGQEPGKSIRDGVPAKVLVVLDQLEKMGQTIKDLQAELKLKKLETLVMDTTVKTGQLYYQRKKKELRFRVSFEQTQYDERKFKDREDFVFGDGWLIHRQERGKREDRYQITRPGQGSADLMRIGKSPLPIPIGQKTEEVLKNFEVSLVEANRQTDPKLESGKLKTVHLKLVPREGTELAMSHVRLEFWLTEPGCLPVRSQWENDSGDIFTADMTELRVNKGIKDRIFKLGKLPKGYQMKPHPLPEEEEASGK